MPDGASFPPEVTGAVLAGGRSSRLGRDKALLTIAGEPLLARAVRILASVCGSVLVVAGPERQALVPGVPVLPDELPGAGPLGGIATALRAIEGERLLAVATDMPLLQPAVLRLLIAASPGYDVTVPRIDGRTQQLCAVYARSCLPLIDGQVVSGDFRVGRFIPRARVRYVEEDELRRYDPDLRSFRNINREEDWRELCHLLGEGLPS